MRYVLVADDHAITRRGVRETLADAFEDIEVHEAENETSVLEVLDTHPWTCIFLDIMMPGRGIVELIKTIRTRHREVPILVLTALTEIEYVVQTLQAGANGILHKHRAAEDLVEAFEQASNGGKYLHPETANAVAKSIGQPPPTLPHESLSPRELDIFRRIALGGALKEIAAELSLSEKTVATYLARIREKTGLSSYVDIARYALQNGVVE